MDNEKKRVLNLEPNVLDGEELQTLIHTVFGQMSKYVARTYGPFGANTAYLRADSAMTSDETTIGVNPVNAVETMARILTYSDGDTIANPYDWSRVDNLPENDWSRSVSSMAYLNHASAIVVFARDTDAVIQISCRKPDIPIIAVCNDAMVANQLCLLRGVSSVFDTQLFGMRDGFNSARRFGVHTGKLVIVDDEKVSLRTLD